MIIEGEHGCTLQDLIQATLATGKPGWPRISGCTCPLFSHHQDPSSRLLLSRQCSCLLYSNQIEKPSFSLDGAKPIAPAQVSRTAVKNSVFGSARGIDSANQQCTIVYAVPPAAQPTHRQLLCGVHRSRSCGNPFGKAAGKTVPAR